MDDWEYDFNNPPRIMPPRAVLCEHCGELLDSGVAVKKLYFDGDMMNVGHFCSDEHHQQWYINRLNEKGM